MIYLLRMKLIHRLHRVHFSRLSKPSRSHVKVSQACSNVKRIVQLWEESTKATNPFQLWFVDAAELVLLCRCSRNLSDVKVRFVGIPYMCLGNSTDQMGLGSMFRKEDHGTAALPGGCLYHK